MKVYISVDMEGCCGVTLWDEVTKGKEGYEQFRQQMTAEAAAACRGAVAAGATEIVVRDAHDSACNIIAGELPEQARLIRGWSRHPYMMMQGLDSSFVAALLVGYHSPAMTGGNPLAHTMNTTRNSSLYINGALASEFMLNIFTAGYERVPVVFVSGDGDLCSHAKELVPSITPVAVKSGFGASTENIHPEAALSHIEQGVLEALKTGNNVKPVLLPENFQIELHYNNHRDAYKASFYPGARLQSPRCVGFQSNDYFEVLRFLLFNF